MDAADTGRAGLVATESATNIVKHAGRGQLLVRPLRETTGGAGVELLALDRGPGMADVGVCMRDGFSTAGSPGTGLGAISRVASSLDVYSAPGAGTALLIRVLPRGAALQSEGSLEVGAVRVAAPGEVECGDDWRFVQTEHRAVLMVADGLGHGRIAAQASSAALDVLESHSHLSATALLTTAHGALRSTRGAAVSVAELDLTANELRYAGLGNVAASIQSTAGSQSLVGQNGTAGGEPRRIRLFTYAWPRGASLLMHTDGLTSHTSVRAYPGLLNHDPTLVAGVLYRDFTRGRDDATVVVLRQAAEAA
jgi:anti-sigma regulatory factor (Ser/Thr protein kinase)